MVALAEGAQQRPAHLVAEVLRPAVPGVAAKDDDGAGRGFEANFVRVASSISRLEEASTILRML